MSDIFTKWVPSVTVAGVIAAGAIALPMQASAVDLPERSVAELLAAMDESVEGFSGSVTKTSNLGLPELEMSQMMSEEMIADMEERMPEGFEDFVPQLVEQNPLTDAISFLAGSDTIRVYASEEGFRAQILDPMSQRDVIVNKDAFYSYNAKTNTVLTRSIDGEVDKPSLDELNSEIELDLTNPDELASALLEEAEGKATITVGADHRVAGQDAYRLVVTPVSEVSLVERIDISVDANTGLGLGVQVYSTEQSDVAFSVAFDTISYDTPEASIFAFSPPPGATVETLEFPTEVESTLTELQREDLSDTEKEALLESLKADMQAEFAPGVTADTLGEGFDTVLTMNQLPEAFPLEMLENDILADFTTEVDGGTVFGTPLSNTLLTDAGEVYTGAVSVEYLLELASN
ncbi:rseB anti-sigma E factor [Pontimonas salivibrio]|uniref:RseB anti-sigma E factor n=1 Tax=Pontimonas salivibrio TaxID=1159327 RepID=A0A2L2BR86_9MICO|nr:hypothetical protein [Pontimonas salivibrio]AVG24186.1 rseB anti-sigma E factor [Pontimonas salivibrio]